MNISAGNLSRFSAASSLHIAASIANGDVDFDRASSDGGDSGSVSSTHGDADDHVSTTFGTAVESLI